jgi:hypothetical protein
MFEDRSISLRYLLYSLENLILKDRNCLQKERTEFFNKDRYFFLIREARSIV